MGKTYRSSRRPTSNSLLLEFTVDAEQFRLGHVLTSAGDLHFELERIVPTAGDLMPFVWVSTQEDPDVVLPAFEERLRESDRVRELVAPDRVDDGGLYRIDWRVHEEGLIDTLALTDATVLEAAGNRTWAFRVHFPDHTRLTDFYNYLTDHDVVVRIDRT